MAVKDIFRVRQKCQICLSQEWFKGISANDDCHQENDNSCRLDVESPISSTRTNGFEGADG
jgi:hypothetical protein